MNANARRLRTGKQTPTPISEYLAAIGSKGGQKSRRKLTKAQAQAMVRAREAKRNSKLIRLPILSGPLKGHVEILESESAKVGSLRIIKQFYSDSLAETKAVVSMKHRVVSGGLEFVEATLK